MGIIITWALTYLLHHQSHLQVILLGHLSYCYYCLKTGQIAKFHKKKALIRTCSKIIVKYT